MLGGEITVLYSSLKESGEGEASLCSMVTDDMTCWKTKLRRRRYRVSGKLCLCECSQALEQLPGEMVNVSCLSVFKRHLDNALNNILYLLFILFSGRNRKHFSARLGIICYF